MKYLLKDQETERIIFREIRESDFNEWLVFHMDPKTSQYWISDLENPEVECEKWYKKQFYRYETSITKSRYPREIEDSTPPLKTISKVS